MGTAYNLLTPDYRLLATASNWVRTSMKIEIKRCFL